MSDGTIYTERLFNAQAIVKNTAVSTDAVDLGKFRAEGNLSLQVAMTGDGTATISRTGSNDGTNYLVPSGDTGTVVAGFLKTSGPGTDGKHIYNIDAVLTRYIKFTVTETGTANPVAITLDLAIQ
jgi:hypothetical protein